MLRKSILKDDQTSYAPLTISWAKATIFPRDGSGGTWSVKVRLTGAAPTNPLPPTGLAGYAVQAFAGVATTGDAISVAPVGVMSADPSDASLFVQRVSLASDTAKPGSMDDGTVLMPTGSSVLVLTPVSPGASVQAAEVE